MLFFSFLMYFNSHFVSFLNIGNLEAPLVFSWGPPVENQCLRLISTFVYLECICEAFILMQLKTIHKVITQNANSYQQCETIMHTRKDLYVFCDKLGL